MIILLQVLAHDPETRPALFRNQMATAVSLHRRFPGPRIIGELCWITADATPEIVGSVNRRNRSYLRLQANGWMATFAEEDERPPGIARKDLTGLVVGSVAVYSARPETVMFIDVGNLKAACGIGKGKREEIPPRNILSTCLIWRIRRKIEVVVFYFHTIRNVAAGEIARSPDARLLGSGKRKRLTRQTLPGEWKESIELAPHLNCGRTRNTPTTMELDGEACVYLRWGIA